MEIAEPLVGDTDDPTPFGARWPYAVAGVVASPA